MRLKDVQCLQLCVYLYQYVMRLEDAIPFVASLLQDITS